MEIPIRVKEHISGTQVEFKRNINLGVISTQVVVAKARRINNFTKGGSVDRSPNSAVGHYNTHIFRV